MKTTLATTGLLVTALALAACATDDAGTVDPDTRITDVDQCLAGICDRAAACPGLASTPAEIAACPAEIRVELSPAQLNELERFITYTKARQDCILACIGQTICGRFGGSVLNLSDSDVMEPYRACEQQCP